MIKKIITTLYILLFSVHPACAEKFPFPTPLNMQYKQEMEQIIDKEYPKIIKNIDKDVKYAKNLRDKILKEGFNVEDYTKLALIPDTHIPSSDLDLYAELLKITTEKYLTKEYNAIETDSSNPYYKILIPYFEYNNVNQNKLKKIIIYQNKKIKVVEKYIKQIEKHKPTSNLYIYSD